MPPPSLERIELLRFFTPDEDADLERCWSRAVRRDLFAMKKSERKFWDQLLLNAGGDGRQAVKLGAWVAKLTPAVFEARLAEWFGAFRASEALVLSPAGSVVLQRLLRICGAVPDLQVDEPLYWLAQARWRDRVVPAGGVGWWRDYLLTLLTRPPDRAFACLEQLMMDRDAAHDPRIQEMYHSQLTSIVKRDVQAVEEKGVDGYPFSAEPAARCWDQAIDEILAAGKSAGLDKTPVLTRSLRQQARGQEQQVLQALIRRSKWIGQERQRFSESNYFALQYRLSGVLNALLKELPQLDRAELISLCLLDTTGVMPGAPTEQILRLMTGYIDRSGYDAELVKLLTDWQKSLHGSIAAQHYRKRVGDLLWLEDATPIALDACWSNRTRADLRQLSSEVREGWLELLGAGPFTKQEKPSAKWLKAAQPALKRIGDQFPARLAQWFLPFREGQPVKLTLAGRDVLGQLLWAAGVDRQPLTLEAVSWFSAAVWKTKDAESRVDSLYSAFASTIAQADAELALSSMERLVVAGKAPAGTNLRNRYQALCAELGRTPAAVDEPVVRKQEPLSLQAIALKTLRRLLPSGERQHWEGQVLVVRGQCDQYRIDTETGRVTRLSDGCSVRVKSGEGLAIKSLLQAIPVGDSLRLYYVAEVLSRDVEWGGLIEFDN